MTHEAAFRFTDQNQVLNKTFLLKATAVKTIKEINLQSYPVAQAEHWACEPAWRPGEAPHR